MCALKRLAKASNSLQPFVFGSLGDQFPDRSTYAINTSMIGQYAASLRATNEFTCLRIAN